YGTSDQILCGCFGKLLYSRREWHTTTKRRADADRWLAARPGCRVRECGHTKGRGPTPRRKTRRHERGGPLQGAHRWLWAKRAVGDRGSADAVGRRDPDRGAQGLRLRDR